MGEIGPSRDFLKINFSKTKKNFFEKMSPSTWVCMAYLLVLMVIDFEVNNLQNPVRECSYVYEFDFQLTEISLFTVHGIQFINKLS